MNFLPVFLLRIIRATPRFDEGRARMVIIIRWPYAYLEAELRRSFEGQEDVQVVVDRRTIEQPVAANRRRPKEEILGVVISG